VYLAECVETGAAVELRVLSGDLARDDELAAAFCAHAALVRSVSSYCPGIARVYECGRPDGGTVTLAADHPAGPTLREAIEREGRLEPERAVRLAIQIAAVLERVHSLGLVHGGLRPDNVVLTGPRETVALTQVGFDWLVLQRAASGGVRTSASSADAAYRAPEQASGSATERSDVYAVGAILYEMLAGAPPPGPGPPDGPEKADALRAQRPEITPSLERTIMRALEPLPAARQADISVLCNDLWDESKFADERSSPEEPKPSYAARVRRPRLDTWPRRLVALGALAGAGALATWLAYPRTPVASMPPSLQAPAAPVATVAPAAVPPAAPSTAEPGALVERPSAPAAPALGAAAPEPPALPPRAPQLPASPKPRSPDPAVIQRPSPARPAPPKPVASPSDAVPRSASPSAVRPPQASQPAERSTLESPSPPATPQRPPGRETVEDPAPIIDWLFTEGSRQRP
jgi:serine/threonine-protein kinase